MRALGLTPALLASLALAACDSSHGRGDVTDGGRGARDSGSAPVDSGAPDSGARVDSGSGVDAGSPVVTCEPDDASAAICPDALCDGPPTYHWDGSRCLPIECGACVGVDCASGSSSLAACESAHAACEGLLCRRTMGQWTWWRPECGHRVCGAATLELCESPYPVCDCGPGRNYFEGVGCRVDPLCGEIDPLDDDAACRSTGGTWGSFCCHSECGDACTEDCVSPACDCGPMRVFEPGRGCVEHARCWERRVMQTCDAMRGAQCEGGSVCCQRCGGAGCFGPALCQAPLCDSDELTDVCGNRLDVP